MLQGQDCRDECTDIFNRLEFQRPVQDKPNLI